MDWSDISRSAVFLLVPACAALFGIWLGARLNDRREAVKRRYEFIARQLDEFYAPLLGIRMEIKARSELRNRISGLSSEAWRELVISLAGAHISLKQDMLDKRGSEFTAIVERDNKQLQDVLLPAYRKMVEIFRDKLWLAESGTRASFPDLIEFVDIWDRFIVRSLPREVLERLQHSEEKLHSFYGNLQSTHDRLRGARVSASFGCICC